MMPEADKPNHTIPSDMLWSIVNEARDLISVSSNEGRVLFINEAGKKMIGLEEDVNSAEVLVWRIYPKRIRKLLLNEVLPHAIKHGSWSGENVIRRADGGEISVSQIIRAHKKEGNEVAFYSTIIRDISTRKNIEQALQSSEKKFFRAFHSSPTMKLMVSLSDERIIDINTSYLTALGYSRESVVGSAISEASICGDENEMRAFMETVRKDDSFENLEISFTAVGGELRMGLFSAEKLEVDGESVLLLEGIDITDRKKAEEQLRKSESKFIKVYQSSPEAIAINKMDDGVYLEVNESALDLTGYRYEEVIGRTSVEMQIFADYRQYLRFLALLRRNGLVKKMELEFKTRHGEIRKGIVSAEMIDLGGEPCVITSTVDITEIKRSEEALQKEREQLAVTLRSIGDGVITTNVEGKVVLINKIAEELTGWSQQDAYGRPLQEIFKIINEITKEPCVNPVDRVLESEGIVELSNHTLLIARDGTERIIADSGAPIRDRDGAIIGVVLVFRDITEKKRLDDELRKMQQVESIGLLAGGIAHDFNNILTSILGNINLGRLYTRPGEMLYEVMLEAEKSAQQARELARRLLSLSKGGKPVRRTGHIEDLVRDSTGIALRGSNIISTFDIQEGLYLAEFDEVQIGQVMNNIVLNARQAMPKGGVLRISVSNVEGRNVKAGPVEKGSFIAIKVEDSGMGIPEADLPYIFDPYFTTKQKGTGLGLTTTFSIIRNHDGYIHLESIPGEGSVFIVYLPAVPKATMRTSHKQAAMVRGEGRVLFMDDEELVRNVADRMIKHLGYEVKTVLNGEEAVEEFDRALNSDKGYDIVILDLTVPAGMGGLEAVEKIRALSPDVPVIVSSGYSNDPIMAEYEKYGFDEVVVKPYKMEELSQALQRALSKRVS